jgi:nucleotide-binding universal stress UspA family protein
MLAEQPRKAIYEVYQMLSGEVVCQFEEAAPTRTIILPITDSPASQHAIHYALDKLIKKTDHVILINCRLSTYTLPLLDPECPLILPEADLLTEKIYREESHKFLRSIATMFKSNDINVRALSIPGDTRLVIKEKVAESQPDLVIIGKGGNSNETNHVSVSNYLIRHLMVPVMVVPYSE